MAILRERPIGDVVADVLRLAATLVRKEGELARVEMSENVGKLATGLVVAVVGGVLMIPALVILFEAAVTAIVYAGLAVYWAALIIGGAAFLIGAALLMIGMNRLSANTLLPKKTMRQWQQDAVVVQMVKDNEDVQRAA
jgi:hypothetical protein